MFVLAAIMTPPLSFIGSLGPTEMLMVAVVALLLFGKDLPNVAREWGKAFNEFRRHLNSVKSDLNDAIYAEPDRPRLQYHPEFHNREEKSTVIDAPAIKSPEINSPEKVEPAAAESPAGDVAAPEFAPVGDATPSD